MFASQDAVFVISNAETSPALASIVIINVITKLSIALRMLNLRVDSKKIERGNG